MNKERNQPLDEDLVSDLERSETATRAAIQELVNLAVEMLPAALVIQNPKIIDRLEYVLEKYSDYMNPDLDIPLSFRRRLYENNYGEDRVEAMIQAGQVNFDSDDAFRRSRAS
jgi:hypothetical protein